MPNEFDRLCFDPNGVERSLDGADTSVRATVFVSPDGYSVHGWRSSDNRKRYYIRSESEVPWRIQRRLRSGRRNFLKGTVGGAAALVAASHPAPAQQEEAVRSATAAVTTQEKDPSPSVEVLTADHPGSDFMVDVLKARRQSDT